SGTRAAPLLARSLKAFSTAATEFPKPAHLIVQYPEFDPPVHPVSRRCIIPGKWLRTSESFGMNSIFLDPLCNKIVFDRGHALFGQFHIFGCAALIIGMAFELYDHLLAFTHHSYNDIK